MPTLSKPNLFNWFCVRCHEWRGIGSMNEARRCVECGTRCQWVEYDVGPMVIADPTTKKQPGDVIPRLESRCRS